MCVCERERERVKDMREGLGERYSMGLLENALISKLCVCMCVFVTAYTNGWKEIE